MSKHLRTVGTWQVDRVVSWLYSQQESAGGCPHTVHHTLVPSTNNRGALHLWCVRVRVCFVCTYICLPIVQMCLTHTTEQGKSHQHGNTNEATSNPVMVSWEPACSAKNTS